MIVKRRTRKSTNPQLCKRTKKKTCFSSQNKGKAGLFKIFLILLRKILDKARRCTIANSYIVTDDACISAIA